VIKDEGDDGELLLKKEIEKSKSAAPIERRHLKDEKYEELLGNRSLLKKILDYGDIDINDVDESNRPERGQMCTIDYEAFLVKTNENDDGNDHEIDESKTVEKNDNYSFILGDGDVVSAIDMAVAVMNKNEKCEVIAEARHHYGKNGK
jgi:hypothetical protein